MLTENGADVGATSNPDTKGARAYLAPTVQQRQNSAQGAGGLGGGHGGRGGGRAGAAPADAGGDQVAAVGAPGAAGDAVVAAGAELPAAIPAATKKMPWLQRMRRPRRFPSDARRDKDGGGLTALVFAAREDCLECAKVLIDARADVNQMTIMAGRLC